jgi:hypothetical protein
MERHLKAYHQQIPKMVKYAGHLERSNKQLQEALNKYGGTSRYDLKSLP